MNPKDLVKVWDAPDNSKLTPKQISIRLPILVAAKINALCEIYPRKTKTEIISDLLSTSLDQLEEGMESVKGDLVGDFPDSNNEPVEIYEMVGLKGRFLNLTLRHLRELEKEAGITEPMKFGTPCIVGDEDGERYV